MSDAPGTFLYLSSREIEALALTPSELRAAISEAILAAPDSGSAGCKQRVQVDDGRFLMSMSDALPALGHGVNKWIGYAAGNPDRGLPTICAQITLSDTDTGRPEAIMDGTWITTHRTAALSAIAAQALSPAGARVLGFLGCGVQAHSHLHALCDALPGIGHVLACSRSAASAEGLAQAARDKGLGATVLRDPGALAEGSDIVVTAMPSVAGIQPVLRPQSLRPGALALGVDLGRAWSRAGLAECVQLFVTDDCSALARAGGNPNLAHQGAYDADLRALLSGAHPGRTSAEQRIMFLFPGMPLADLAVARLALGRATARGLGTRLER